MCAGGWGQAIHVEDNTLGTITPRPDLAYQKDVSSVTMAVLLLFGEGFSK